MKKLLYFSATWCGPCRILGPVLSNLQAEQGINIQKVNVDDNPELASKYSVRNIPTVIKVENNKETGRVVGSQTKSTYINLWNQ